MMAVLSFLPPPARSNLGRRDPANRIPDMGVVRGKPPRASQLYVPSPYIGKRKVTIAQKIIGGNPCQLWPCGPEVPRKSQLLLQLNKLGRHRCRRRHPRPRQTPAVPLPLHHQLISVRSPQVEESAIGSDFARIILCNCPRDRHECCNRSSAVSFQFVQPSRPRVVLITKIAETYKNSPLLSHRKSVRFFAKPGRQGDFPAR